MNQRLVYVDILKAFAIYLVIIDHVIPYWTDGTSGLLEKISSIILSFHMPLFAIISGMFMELNDSLLIFLRKKFFRLILPFLCFSLISSIAISHNVDELRILGVFWYRPWFIIALILCTFVAYFSAYISRSRGLYIGLCSVMFIQSLAFLGIIPNAHYLLSGFIFLYPFYWIGIWTMKDFRFIEQKWKYLLPTFAFFFAILLFSYRGMPDAFYNKNTSIFVPYGVDDIVGFKVITSTIYRFAIGLFGSLTFILLFWKLFNKNKKNKLISLVSQIGRNTLGIYLLQDVICYVKTEKYSNFLEVPFGESHKSFLFVCCFSLLLTLFLHFFCLLIKKSRILSGLFLGTAFK